MMTTMIMTTVTRRRRRGLNPVLVLVMVVGVCVQAGGRPLRRAEGGVRVPPARPGHQDQHGAAGKQTSSSSSPP